MNYHTPKGMWIHGDRNLEKKKKRNPRLMLTAEDFLLCD